MKQDTDFGVPASTDVLGTEEEIHISVYASELLQIKLRRPRSPVTTKAANVNIV